MNKKLQLLTDLISCNMPILYWHYDEEGNDFESSEIGNQPDPFENGTVPSDFSDNVRHTSHIIFLYSHCFENVKKHFEETDRPLVISISIGLMWAVAVEKTDGAKHFHVIGPAFLNSISHADVLRNIQPLENAGHLTLKDKRRFIDSIYTLPVIAYTTMLQYAVWLHYCINGERLSLADVTTERSSRIPEHAKHTPLPTDRHRAYMVECALLRAVQNGDANYKDIWAKAIQMEVFDTPFVDSPLEAKKISCIQFTKLCAHYASLGGLSPAVGYDLESAYHKAILSANQVSVLQTLQNDILDTFIKQVRQHKAALNSHISPEIQRGCEYILQNVESDLTLEDIAAQTGYTPYYFSRKFKQEMGESVNHYIKAQKIEHSKMLLMTTDLSVQEIADKLSLCSPTYFSSAFHSLTGCTPTQYRTGRTA